jgi:hypothetical protein
MTVNIWTTKNKFTNRVKGAKTETIGVERERIPKIAL